jgi:hypothetical protein
MLINGISVLCDSQTYLELASRLPLCSEDNYSGSTISDIFTVVQVSAGDRVARRRHWM